MPLAAAPVEPTTSTSSIVEATFATTLSQPCSQLFSYLSKLFEGKKVWEGLQGNLALTPMGLLQALGRRWPGEPGSRGPDLASKQRALSERASL